ASGWYDGRFIDAATKDAVAWVTVKTIARRPAVKSILPQRARQRVCPKTSCLRFAQPIAPVDNKHRRFASATVPASHFFLRTLRHKSSRTLLCTLQLQPHQCSKPDVESLAPAPPSVSPLGPLAPPCKTSK